MAPSTTIQTFGTYEIDDDRDRLDLDAIWSFLSTEAYWGRQRSREQVERQIAASWRVVGVYTPAGEQVGLARAESDGVANAYLTDVYVTAPHRAHGVGAAMLDELIERGPGSGLRWMLHTVDGHSFYRRLGFSAPDRRFMEREAPSSGVDDARDRSATFIQQAGTLLDRGRAAEALDVLADDDNIRTATERAAFAALALHDLGRSDEALATALEALAPLLNDHGGSVTSRAGELRGRAIAQSSDS